MSGEKQTYAPFSRVPESYPDDIGTIEYRVINALKNCFGIPRIVIKSDFKEAFKEMLGEEYPALCCSPARAILEGRIPGLPKPAQPLRKSKQLEQILCVLDVFETLVCRHLEKMIAEQSISVRREADVVGKTFGGTKIPGLMEAVLKGQSDAFKDKKTGKGHGSRMQRKGKVKHSKESGVRVS